MTTPITASVEAAAKRFVAAWPTCMPDETRDKLVGALTDALLLVSRDASPTAPPLCYPFSVNTCNNPRCTCRAEKAASPTAPRVEGGAEVVIDGDRVVAWFEDKDVAKDWARECFDDESGVVVRPYQNSLPRVGGTTILRSDQ